MKNISFLMYIFLVALLCFTEAILAQDESSQERVLIGFKDKTGWQAAERHRTWVREFGGKVRYSYRFLPTVAARISKMQISKLKADPRVAYIEEDGKVYALDSELDNSWGVKLIGAGNVHSYNKGTGIKVAIIDTGIDYDHPDLSENYQGGYDFANDDDNPMDDNGHGTHCAGIAAAEDDDNGVIGVAPEAFLYALKTLDSSGSGYISDAIAGIEWSIDKNMDIISMSFGTNIHSQALQNACGNAYSNGLLLISAAGNDYKRSGTQELDTIDYPARYDSVIAVGAIGKNNTKASWSSTGPALELVAPGVSIYSTYWNDTYVLMSGTSMACPHVAGVAALIWTGEPGLTNLQVRSRLHETAKDLGAAGKDQWYGYGLVNAAAAIIIVEPPAADFTAGPKSGDVPLTVQFTDRSTGNISNWLWTFGDEISSAERNPSHTYQNTGDYIVSLKVTGTGGSDTETKTNFIHVTAPPPPVADFTASPTTGDAPLTVYFTDQSTGNITSRLWDFGDGESSAQPNPIHQYKNADSYTVTLTVTGLGGSDTEIKAGYINVSEPPTPTLVSIAVTPTTALIKRGSTQQYTAKGTYSDGGTTDITADVLWASSNTSVATINASGSAAATGAGTTEISASLNAITSNKAILSVTETPAAPAIHIGDITFQAEVWSWRGLKTLYRITVIVPILDSSDAAVNGAIVYGSWSGPYNRNESAFTNIEGNVIFRTSWILDGGKFTFKVNDVKKTGWTYNSENNIETYDSITVP